MNGTLKQPTAATPQYSFHTVPATDREYRNAFSYAHGNDVDPRELNLGHTKTDRRKWRLLDERGRQRWRYLRSEEEAQAWPIQTFENYALGLDTVCMHALPFPSGYQTLMNFVGTTRPHSCTHTLQGRGQWPQLLQPAATRTRQLGL